MLLGLYRTKVNIFDKNATDCINFFKKLHVR
jgi:hypothetical protein